MENTEASVRICPVCHVQVRPADYFCYNCGKELSEAATPIKTLDAVGVLIGSILLPPMGIIWGIKYLRKNSLVAKLVGLTAIVLTVAALVAAISYANHLLNTMTQQLNEQLLEVQGIQ